MSGRPGLACLFAVALPFGALAPTAVRAQNPTEDKDPIEGAKTLYQQGSTLYSAADYAGAIEKFTEALGIITAEGSAEHASIRGALLFNIARSHSNAYEVDRDLAHLRTARSIFERFINESKGGGYEASDITEAKRERERIDTVLAEAESEPGPDPDPDPKPPQADLDREKKVRSTRTQGIALTTVGAVLLPAGAVLLGVGAADKPQTCSEYDLRPAAEKNGVACDDIYNTTVDTAANDGLEESIRFNARRATILMVSGGVAMGVGVIGLGVGIAQLVRAKSMGRKNEQNSTGRLQWSPWLGRETAGLTLSGRF